MSVMGVKQGVQTWRDNPEPDLRADNKDSSFTPEMKKQLGADNMGDLLNKVSDPKYVDPAKKMRGVGNNSMDKDAFFKLMLAQLKNQDPSNPLKNHEMAAQLAQFSTLEQMTNVNSTLKEMKAGNKPIEQFQALNLIGKQVGGDSSKLARTDLDKDHDFRFKLPSDVNSATIKVINSKGAPIREYTFNLLKEGDNKITWNGEDEKGVKAKPGDYQFQIEAVGTNGQKVQVQTEFEGIVSGMSFSPEGPILQVGKQSVRLKDIRQFTDPSLKSNDQISRDVTQLDLKAKDPMQQTKMKQETKTPEQERAMAASTDELLEQVGMEGNLLNEVKNKLEGGETSQQGKVAKNENAEGGI